MRHYRIRIELKSAFGTVLKGDTLFGQLCWGIVHRHGEARLQELLRGYRKQPFVICSDGFPSGYFPLPRLPAKYFDFPNHEDRKTAKKRCWIPFQDYASHPLRKWLCQARTNTDVFGDSYGTREQPHNSINRLTGTTGEGIFAPYSQPQIWYGNTTSMDIYLMFDDSRISLREIRGLFDDIGAFGYGRDASIGLGKFDCLECTKWDIPVIKGANACLTLAPCVPQGLGLDGKRSYYDIFTRFGRHGSVGVHQGHPFKAPVLLADTAAVFSPVLDERDYIGQGLGGTGELSKSIPQTVHQGYAPCLPVHIPFNDCGDSQ